MTHKVLVTENERYINVVLRGWEKFHPLQVSWEGRCSREILKLLTTFKASQN